jgi:hypothetical protein
MAISIFHIGLPLNHPLIPVEDRPKIEQRLSNLKLTMRNAGYNYDILHASPEGGLEEFRHRLKTEPCDGVLIGGGVAGDPSMSYFMERIINTAHEAAPGVKIMFYSHSEDVRTTVERWFKPA